MKKNTPENSFLNAGISVDNSGGWVNQVQSIRTLPLGDFENSKDIDETKGKISLQAEDNIIKVFERQAFSNWSNTDVNQAALQNINLIERLFSGANQIYLRNIDLIGLIGVPNVSNSFGLLNSPSFPVVASGGTIETRTPQEMYDEISDLIQLQWNAVNNTEEYQANRVIMPVNVFNRINKTILNSAAGSFSVLKSLQDNYPEIQFFKSFRAANGAPGALSGTVAYSNSDEVMTMRIPLTLTIGEVVRINSFDFRTDYKYRIAGLDILESTGGYIKTGL